MQLELTLSSLYIRKIILQKCEDVFFITVVLNQCMITFMFISTSNLINSHTTSGPCLHYRTSFNWTFIKTNALSGYTHSIWLRRTGMISWMGLLCTTPSPPARADCRGGWLDCCAFCWAALSATALSVSRTGADPHAARRTLPLLLHRTGFLLEEGR